jgi:hypothetical protein
VKEIFYFIFNTHKRTRNTLCGISFRIASQKPLLFDYPSRENKTKKKIGLCFPVVSDKEIVRPLLTHVIRIAF